MKKPKITYLGILFLFIAGIGLFGSDDVISVKDESEGHNVEDK